MKRSQRASGSTEGAEAAMPASGLRSYADEASITDERPTADRYVPGQRIGGKYRLEKPLGLGGMGEVWVAHNEQLDTRIAIKLIRAETESEVISDRMLREARMAAQLGHPNIVRVFDFGTTQLGDPYLVMELLDGEDLATTMAQRGRVSGDRAVQLLLPVIHALSSAHERGIVHRDIKPENIFLASSHDGTVQPKLVDFGVAKHDKQGFERLTAEGTVVGSPGYIPPEQARGDDVDHRADLWSICVVLYELVAGRRPFEGKNYNALMRAIIEDDPEPTTMLAAGDGPLWEIIERGLAKDPAERWQTAHELGAALASWLIDHDVWEDITGRALSKAWSKQAGSSVDALSSVPPQPLLPVAGEREPLRVDVATVPGARNAARAKAVAGSADRRPTRWRFFWVAAAALVALGALAIAFTRFGQKMIAPADPEIRGAQVGGPPPGARERAPRAFEPEPAVPVNTDEPLAAEREQSPVASGSAPKAEAFPGEPAEGSPVEARPASRVKASPRPRAKPRRSQSAKPAKGSAPTEAKPRLVDELKTTF